MDAQNYLVLLLKAVFKPQTASPGFLWELFEPSSTHSREDLFLRVLPKRKHPLIQRDPELQDKGGP